MISMKNEVVSKIEILRSGEETVVRAAQLTRQSMSSTESLSTMHQCKSTFLRPLHIAYLGLGANWGEPLEQIQKALNALQQLPYTRVERVSRCYQSPPLGPPQPDYLNAVACLKTALMAEALLPLTQQIEKDLGRVRTGERWGPRTIDIDILLYDDQVISTPQLIVPHPGIAERAFVLYPLWEIAPDHRLPNGSAVAELKKHCGQHSVVPIGSAIKVGKHFQVR